MGFFRLQKRNQSLSLHSPPRSPVIILPSSSSFPPPPSLPGGSSSPGLSDVSLPEHSIQNPSSFRCNFRQVSLSPLSKKPHSRYPVPINFLHRIYHTLKFLLFSVYPPWSLAQSLLSCLALCEPMGYSPRGSSVYGIL
ncbi:unnamed protein product [Rangifer tarandus platyrhynchus]|uniref:Uncharacterized protein n=1 Tax=Rangifer tarandus platyrhynchus TaxID=3082113 RepID=A0ABN8YJD8_RANTA|nr:unnamed protein product [Rangifer tarandus platyrhynchus]